MCSTTTKFIFWIVLFLCLKSDPYYQIILFSSLEFSLVSGRFQCKYIQLYLMVLKVIFLINNKNKLYNNTILFDIIYSSGYCCVWHIKYIFILRLILIMMMNWTDFFANNEHCISKPYFVFNILYVTVNIGLELSLNMVSI